MPVLDSISPVIHVGELDADRAKPYFSHEGDGLCVSQHPAAWRRIAAGVSGSAYRLVNPDSTFYRVTPSNVPLDTHYEWCLDNGFIEDTTAYRVPTDDGYFEFYDAATAEAEAAEYGSTPEQISSIQLGGRGEAYWESAFREAPANAAPVGIRGLLVVWYAENALDVDGVWWDYEYTPAEYSCPCGVIFQDRLSRWTVESP